MKERKTYLKTKEFAEYLNISRTTTYQLAHHVLAYKYTCRTPGGGKILFCIEDFEKVRGAVMRSVNG